MDVNSNDDGHRGDGHPHDHEGHRHGFGGEDHSRALRGASKRSLVSAFVLIAGFMFVEVIGGILSGSLALLADAGHMLTDAASIALALVAMQFATPTCFRGTHLRLSSS